jgi:hypothetical protein
MRRPTFDPTAGERARAIRARPGAPQLILDPTHPRYRELRLAGEGLASDARRILDPTDSKRGELAG